LDDRILFIKYARGPKITLAIIAILHGYSPVVRTVIIPLGGSETGLFGDI
jgi:hypothetical protein